MGVIFNTWGLEHPINIVGPFQGFKKGGRLTTNNITLKTANCSNTWVTNQNAPKQYHILQKFRNRKHLGNYGLHHNGSMASNEEDPVPTNSLLEMRRAGYGQLTIMENAPVYRLESPTFHVPTKSTAFDPSIIDTSGKMHIDWSNPYIYKVLFPAIGISTFGSLNNN